MAILSIRALSCHESALYDMQCTFPSQKNDVSQQQIAMLVDKTRATLATWRARCSMVWDRVLQHLATAAAD